MQFGGIVLVKVRLRGNTAAFIVRCCLRILPKNSKRNL